MLRLVASDIDGTLVRADKTASDRTRRALEQIQEAGVVVVLVTARPAHTAEALAHATGVSGLLLCSNGAVVYDLARQEVVRHTPLEVETARRLIVALREAEPEVCFAFIRERRFACEPAYQRIADPADHADGFLASAILDDALVLCDEAPTKLVVRHPTIHVDDLLLRVHALGLDGFEATHSGASFVEVAAAGSPKRGRSPRSAPTSGSAPTRWSRSATPRTTCRCCAGPGAGSPWPTPTRPSSKPWARSRRPTRTTASP